MVRFLICSIILQISCVNAHFPLVDNAHGGDVYDTWDNAAFIEDIDRSSTTSRVALCGHLYLWLRFRRPNYFNRLMVGATVPVIERFKDIRVAVAVFGRGLPGIAATQAEINQYCYHSPVGRLCRGYTDLPEDLQTAFTEIQDRMGVSDLGVVAVPGVEDQSNCDFGEDPLTVDVTGSLYVTDFGGNNIEFASYSDWGGQSHCYFHEEFGGTDAWLVQDKLIDLRGEGNHFIVYWSPGDDSLGAPTTPAKFTAIFGDEGQSENFQGETALAGECSLPKEDFYEQDCHGYELPIIPSLIERALRFMDFFNLIEDNYDWIFNAVYIPWGGAPCEPSYAVTIPNVYTCGDDTPEKACTGLCHNHGDCPAAGMRDFNTSVCTSDTDENGFPMCGETCARELCGADQNTTQKGPVGPACDHVCEADCTLLNFFLCDNECDLEISFSSECDGFYEFD